MREDPKEELACRNNPNEPQRPQALEHEIYQKPTIQNPPEGKERNHLKKTLTSYSNEVEDHDRRKSHHLTARIPDPHTLYNHN